MGLGPFNRQDSGAQGPDTTVHAKAVVPGVPAADIVQIVDSKLQNAPTPDQPSLIVRADGQIVKAVPLGSRPIRIGRIRDNDVTIKDPAVSRHHVEVVLIKVDGQSCVQVRDLNSRNGTFVDGKRIVSQRLYSGDVAHMAQGKRQIEIEFHNPLADMEETLAVPRLDPVAQRAERVHAELIIESGPGAGGAIDMGPRVVPLGPRDAPSRVAILKIADNYVLMKLWGGQGAKINGRPMEKRSHVLADGDFIEFLDRSLRFHLLSGTGLEPGGTP